MEQYQPHSKVQKIGNEFVVSNTQVHMTTGTKLKEITLRQNLLVGGSAFTWLVPLYNLFDIPPGSTTATRNSNSIFIHRIEFEYCLSEPVSNQVGPDEIANVNAQTSNRNLTDSRYRIMIVNPKFSYNNIPADGNTVPTFPYFSATDANYKVKLSPPILNDYANCQGMVGLPDPKRFTVEFDDLRNLRRDGGQGQDSGSFSFLIRKRFDYQEQTTFSVGEVQMQDMGLQELIPQIWFFTPKSGCDDDGTSITSSTCSLKFECKIRMVYDNIA